MSLVQCCVAIIGYGLWDCFEKILTSLIELWQGHAEYRVSILPLRTERLMPIPIFLKSLARFSNNPLLQLHIQLYEASVYTHAP